VRRAIVAAVCGLLALQGCTNNPYPDADSGQKVLYSSFVEAPRTLDPAVAYTTAEQIVTANVYDTLLEYHYLRRPYELIPGVATAVPDATERPGGGQSYRFKLREGVYFHPDPSFALGQAGRRTRKAVAADVAFQLARLADPAVNSPVASTFADIPGFVAFGKRLVEMRKTDTQFAALPRHVQYEKVGGIEGIVLHGELDLEIIVSQANPQILYWFAMPFTTPMPWEAIAYYDGKEGRGNLSDQAVGTGPFRLARYEKQHRFTLEKFEDWYGLRNTADSAPGAVFPSDISPEDVKAGHIDPIYAGKRMPFLERIVFTREREGIPRFNKMLQGYYDDGGIIKESFDAIVQDDRLSPEMAARGLRLDKEVEPTIFYVGFNMDDPTLGHAAGDKGRKLRQAMSVVVDVPEYLRLFLNGRGEPAQSPLPPAIFGYDKDYKNPFRQPDIARGRALLAEAGYRNGIDPKTGQPLQLSFDTGNTTAQALLQYQFMVNAWRQLGLDVRVNATTYNQFQQKVRQGAYQIFQWGWVADFPDPENFLFILVCENSRTKSQGANTANFCDAEYDGLYREMKNLANTEHRQGIIRKMIAILERERPWIELFHNESYTLNHAWLVNAKPIGLSYPVFKYKDVQPKLRAEMRAAWNQPVRWPLYLLALAIAAAAWPAVRTYQRERQ
jgi:oligopeptide transport system substrate-binding protein